MIAILDNVLSPEECNYIIACYEKRADEAGYWDGTRPMYTDLIPNSETYLEKIVGALKVYYPYVELDWAQVVKWNIGVDKKLHLDNASTETVLSSVTYLNNDYVGGGTFFQDGTVIKPCIGRTSVFHGRKYPHGVETVLDRPRYTIPIWYKRKEHENL